MEHLEETTKAILKSPYVTSGTRWAKPESAPLTIRYTFVTQALPQWIVTRLRAIPRPAFSWNLLKVLADNPSLPHKDFEGPGLPLPPDLSPYFHIGLRHWETVMSVRFVHDNKNPTLFLHFSENSVLGILSMWSASTMLDIKNGTIVNAAINFHLSSLREALNAKKPCFTQHIFTHELAHVLGLFHPNISNPGFRVDHYTIMAYAKNRDKMLCAPTEVDHRALETLYGPHPISPENNTYFFNATSFKKGEIAWHLDHNGTDTLIAHCPAGRYDLQKGILEGCDNIEYVTPNALENINVTGKGVLIQLNLQTNHVDIQNATMASIYTSAVESSGNADFIYGYKCGDKLFIAHPSLPQPTFHFTQQALSLTSGNYTLTAFGNFSAEHIRTISQNGNTVFSYEEPNCPYVDSTSPAYTFAGAFLKTQLAEGIRKLLRGFGYTDIALEAFDRVLIGTLAFYETQNIYLTSMLAVFGPALRLLNLSRTQANMIETVLTVGVGLYNDPIRMLTAFAGSFFAYGTNAAARKWWGSSTPAPAPIPHF